MPPSPLASVWAGLHPVIGFSVRTELTAALARNSLSADGVMTPPIQAGGNASWVGSGGLGISPPVWRVTVWVLMKNGSLIYVQVSKSCSSNIFLNDHEKYNMYTLLFPLPQLASAMVTAPV